MHLQLDLIRLCIYVSQVILVAANTVRNGHFEISRRSRIIKDCASKLMSKEEFTGLVRVNTSDGQCESLSKLWQEESIEPIYDYAKLTTTRQRFISPKSVHEHDDLRFNWPVSITSWTRFSLYATWPQERWDRLNTRVYKMTLSDTSNDRHLTFKDDLLPGTECNMTFAVTGIQNITVLFNGTTMTTMEEVRLDLDRLELVKISYGGFCPPKGFLIHGFDLIQG